MSKAPTQFLRHPKSIPKEIPDPHRAEMTRRTNDRSERNDYISMYRRPLHSRVENPFTGSSDEAAGSAIDAVHTAGKRLPPTVQNDSRPDYRQGQASPLPRQ